MLSQSAWAQVYFFVFFLYGLAFFVMGVGMLLEANRLPVVAATRSLRFLAAFGLIHGSHEWLEALLLQARLWEIPVDAGIDWIRLGMLLTSFLCLLIFAISLWRFVSFRFNLWQVYGGIAVYEAGIWISAWFAWQKNVLPWLDFLDALVRYQLAVPAATLSALALKGLSAQVGQQGRVSLAKNMTWSSAGFGLYAITQLFVRSLPLFPANVLNEQVFLLGVGFPIQVVRTIAAMGITIGLLMAAQTMDAERKKQFIAAQQAQLEALRERDALRGDLLRHIVQAQEEERARIARELHDETAQVLSAFTLELATLRDLTRRRPEARQAMERLNDLSRQMAQAIYRMIYDLRPAQLDDLGLVAALKSYFEQDCAAQGLQVEFEVSGHSRRLEPLVETVLFRVAQEALCNVLRHSGANQAWVRLRYEAGQVGLQVVDQGCGFNPNESFHPPRGWGLAGMRERVEAAGGTLRLISAPGQGTTVDVWIPIPEEERNGTDHDYAGG
jgi:signal transduction histidine kinase